MNKTLLDIHIEQQYDDGVYLYATVKQKPGLIATGGSLPELLDDLQGEIKVWDEAYDNIKNNEWPL